MYTTNPPSFSISKQMHMYIYIYIHIFCTCTSVYSYVYRAHLRYVHIGAQSTHCRGARTLGVVHAQVRENLGLRGLGVGVGFRPLEPGNSVDGIHPA